MFRGIDVSNAIKEKKTVSRTVALALVAICIVLLISLAGVYANYTSIIGDKDSAISSLTSQMTNLDNQVTSLQSGLAANSTTITSLNSQITSLQNQVLNLTSISNLNQSTIWKNQYNVTQPSAKYGSSNNPAYSLLTFTANYAGYVNVSVTYSSKPNIYVKVTYATSNGIGYNNTVSLNGATLPSYAVFPVVPASIQITIGNAVIGSNAPQTVTETVTITYHY